MKRIQTSIEMNDEISLHEKGWVVQRVGWGLLIVLLVMAALGLFGNGVLSHTSVPLENGRITYEKFGRFETEMPLKLRAVSVADKLEVRFPLTYLNQVEIEKANPEPISQRIEGNYCIVTFAARGEVDITVYLVPRTTGNISGAVDINGKQVKLSHFIYP